MKFKVTGLRSAWPPDRPGRCDLHLSAEARHARCPRPVHRRQAGRHRRSAGRGRKARRHGPRAGRARLADQRGFRIVQGRRHHRLVGRRFQGEVHDRDPRRLQGLEETARRQGADFQSLAGLHHAADPRRLHGRGRRDGSQGGPPPRRRGRDQRPLRAGALRRRKEAAGLFLDARAAVREEDRVSLGARHLVPHEVQGRGRRQPGQDLRQGLAPQRGRTQGVDPRGHRSAAELRRRRRDLCQQHHGAHCIWTTSRFTGNQHPS